MSLEEAFFSSVFGQVVLLGSWTNLLDLACPRDLSGNLQPYPSLSLEEFPPSQKHMAQAFLGIPSCLKSRGGHDVEVS